MTVVAALMVTVHVLVPLHPPPLQPANVAPGSATAVSTTDAPDVKLAMQVVPQLIPAGALVTVPVPLPVAATVSTTPVPEPT